jgi:hypothetical protein
MNAENGGILNKDGMDQLSFGDDSYLGGEEKALVGAKVGFDPAKPEYEKTIFITTPRHCGKSIYEQWTEKEGSGQGPEVLVSDGLDHQWLKGWPSPVDVNKLAKNYFKNKRKRERDKSARLYVVLLVLACLVSGVLGAVLSKLGIHFGSKEWFLITGISLVGNLVNWFLGFKIGFGK